MIYYITAEFRGNTRNLRQIGVPIAIISINYLPYVYI